jgi:hypothetical protein
VGVGVYFKYHILSKKSYLSPMPLPTPPQYFLRNLPRSMTLHRKDAVKELPPSIPLHII